MKKKQYDKIKKMKTKKGKQNKKKQDRRKRVRERDKVLKSAVRTKQRNRENWEKKNNFNKRVKLSRKKFYIQRHSIY